MKWMHWVQNYFGQNIFAYIYIRKLQIYNEFIHLRKTFEVILLFYLNLLIT